MTPEAIARRAKSHERRRLRREAKEAKKQAAKEAEENPIVDDGEPAKVKSFDELKKDFSKAFELLGGVQGLVNWGQRDPKAFYQIWARVCVPQRRERSDGGSGQSFEDLLADLDSEGATQQ